MKQVFLFLLLIASFWSLMACNAPASAPKNEAEVINKTPSVADGSANKDSVPECCQSNIPSRFAMGKKMDSTINQLAHPD